MYLSMVTDVFSNINEQNGLLQLVIPDVIGFNKRNIAVIEAAPLALSISVCYVRNIVA